MRRDCGGNFLRPRVLDRIQGIDGGPGEIRHCARNPAEQHQAFFVGDRRDGIDDFRGRVLAKEADKRGASFGSPHPPKSASGRRSNMRMKIVEKIEQERNHCRHAAGATACVGAYLRDVVPKQAQDDRGRQLGFEACRRGDRPLQRRSLDGTLDDKPCDRPGRLDPADCHERIECSRLLGNGRFDAEPGEASADVLERGDGVADFAPRDFGYRSEAVAEAFIEDGGNEPVVIEAIPRDGWFDAGAGIRAWDRGTAPRKEIELHLGHEIQGSLHLGAEEQSKVVTDRSLDAALAARLH